MAIAPQSPPPSPLPLRRNEAQRSDEWSSASPSPPPPTPPPEAPRPGSGGTVAGLLLVAMGVFLLVTMTVPLGGGALFLGLGTVFLIARFMTGQYGFAVPAGILLGFGTFVALDETAFRFTGDQGGWFFILLGAGFLATYVIGMRPVLIWPLYPAAALAAFGVLIQGWMALPPLAGYAWVAGYWPVTLVVIGVWLLVRDRVPAEIARVLGLLITVGAILYGVIAIGAVAAAATGGRDFAGTINLPGMTLPVQESVNLSAPMSTEGTLSIVNPNGRTVVRPATDGATEVQAVATIRGWGNEEQPTVRLTPAGTGATLEVQTVPGQGLFNIRSGAVDLDVTVPESASLNVTTSSGDLLLQGLSGGVTAHTSSGDAHLQDLSGPVRISTSSGDVELTNVAGDLYATTSSGTIRGSGLANPLEATTSSGDVALAGTFSDDARIRTSSGDVTLRLAPDSMVRVEVNTTSGDINADDLGLAGLDQERRSLRGSLRDGEALLRVDTTSGDVDLVPGG